MFDDLVNCFPPIRRRTFGLATEFAGSLSHKHHFHVGWRKVPIGGSRWHIGAGQIRELMARAALHPVLALSVRAALNVLGVRAAIVPLQGCITCGMAVLASRMREDRRRSQECGAGHRITCRLTWKEPNLAPLL